MTIDATAEWLRRSRTAGDRWWTLQPEQFRLAVWLLSVADVRDGAIRVTGALDEMAKHLGMSRAKLRRALDALQQVEFCDLFGQRGKGGLTMILLRELPAPKSNGHAHPVNRVQQQDIAGIHNDRGWVPDHPPDPGEITGPEKSAGHLQLGEISCDGDLADRDLLRSPKISDPDLGSDLRSSTHENITRSTELQFAGRANWVTSERNEPADTEVQAPPQPGAIAAIQDRAWFAADYLRAKVLAEDRSALVGTRPWSTDQKVGLRLTWANEFRLLHSRVHRGLRNGNPQASESEAWDLIAKTVYWLFHGQQPGGPRFEVESPRSLAKKWDGIQRIRRRPAVTEQPRGADKRPDPQAARQFERWTP